ncbi:HAD hydrolase [Rickenella mellea]|uniref:HAD hydrolase n=1 Tax=Rickenella mellea TaxID=50990 RepID=A0A4Y7Q6Y9_9AGAM|nr:HAD hydrolase [Rickenella mellea]
MFAVQRTLRSQSFLHCKTCRISDRHIRSCGIQTPERRSPVAFAFDIDGVLLRGKEVLPQARRALRLLDGENKLGMKIPHIFITNGGGVAEDIRCRKLTSQLGVEIKPTQLIQAHTVLKSVASQYADSPVLVLGGKGDDLRLVAEEYGFRRVTTPIDIHAWNPSIWPFYELSPYERERSRPFDPTIPLRAAFVFHDPRNWSLDIQILCDILQSRGYVGNADYHNNTAGREPVELVFCNPDLLWGSDFPVARIGQGGFREAFQGVYKALTGSRYPYVQYGKPSEATFRFAERILLDLFEDQGTSDANRQIGPSIYMIGDNPESDIAGANGANWSSILVKTGVYREGSGPPSHRPTLMAEDVEEAITMALRRESVEL